MARRSLSSVLSGDEQDLHEVWEWYVFQRELLGNEAVRALQAFAAGVMLSEPRYFGKSQDELSAFFDGQRTELQRVTMMVLLAATEAALRIDYIIRVRERRKDGVTRKFRDLYKDKKLEIGLEDGLLQVWKKHHPTPSRMKPAAGRFKEALRLRHWLAHGRYWKPRLSQEFDPQLVFDICDELLGLVAA